MQLSEQTIAFGLFFALCLGLVFGLLMDSAEEPTDDDSPIDNNDKPLF